tara:strand:+ start:139 stop:453 length:315 start_codon:yes stop_codon:yes gene_type:complete
MLKLKNDSIIPHLSSGMLFGLIAIDQAYEAAGVPETVVTSAMDGPHKRGSLHYSGNAVDIRTRNATESQLTQIVAQLRSNLNEHYDVILEADHLHVEFDVKRLR